MFELHTTGLDIWDVLATSAILGSLIGWAIIRVQYTVDRANLKIEQANNTILRHRLEGLEEHNEYLEGLVGRQVDEINVLKANDWGALATTEKTT